MRWGGEYFNPLFPRGKRLHKPRILVYRAWFQSTLPSREETWNGWICAAGHTDFNPLFPRGKRRIHRHFHSRIFQFQSTLPSREETRVQLLHRLRVDDFNPLFPRGKRPPGTAVTPVTPADFNPLFPRGKRLVFPSYLLPVCPISIHSSLAGRDRVLSWLSWYNWNFNPLFPRGKRHLFMRGS